MSEGCKDRTCRKEEEFITMEKRFRLLCSACGKLLAVGEPKRPIEIKCPRCKEITKFQTI